jgi:hypothetical protein
MLGGLVPPAPAQSSWRFAGVSFPSAIDTFVSQATYRWPDQPGLGVSLTYVIPGDQQTELTVYVYPVRQTDSAAALGDAAPERDRAAGEIKQYAAQNRQLDELRVDSQGVMRVSLPGGRSATGAFAAFFFRRAEHRVVSLLYVFVRGPVYIKIRASLPAGSVSPSPRT